MKKILVMVMALALAISMLATASAATELKWASVHPPEQVVCLVDIAHLRALCQRLGVNRVTGAPGSLVLRLDADYMPDVNRLYRALGQGDGRLIFSASREPALVFHENRQPAETLISHAVPVLEKVLAAL